MDCEIISDKVLLQEKHIFILYNLTSCPRVSYSFSLPFIAIRALVKNSFIQFLRIIVFLGKIKTGKVKVVLQ